MLPPPETQTAPPEIRQKKKRKITLGWGTKVKFSRPPLAAKIVKIPYK